LAQQVGVSPGAPYHHFPDRRSFLLALAVDSFEQLEEQAADDADSGISTHQSVADRARQFVSFALENPHMLELMYESELTRPELDPQLRTFQEKSHTAGTEIIMQNMPGLSEKEAGLRNMGLWTSIYGLVSMIAKGIIRPFGDGDYTLDEICDWVVDRAARSALAP
jgi:AcrR family transcriptional regulator